MRKYIIICTALLATLLAVPAFAAQLKVFVSEINAVGVANKEEMKMTIQALLASRLNSDRIASVASSAEADVIVSGTYVSIGKVFSVDALAKTSSGKTITRSFVQGENQDELIPSIGKLADKLSAELVQQRPAAQPAQTPQSVVTARKDIIKAEAVVPAATSEFIKPKEYEQGNAGGWTSKRLTGASNLMALGGTLADGSRQIFLAEDRRFSYYQQSQEMKLIAEIELGPNEKIVSLDALVAGNATELYVSIIRGNDVSSQVWQAKDNKLTKIADNVSYFFRVISRAGGPEKLYVQGMGRGDDDFYGDVYEASFSGGAVTLKNSFKMPRFGNIYSFNQFNDASGNTFTAVINPDNYLIVYDKDQNELWRSNDKFGGSELYFLKEQPSNVRVTDDKPRWIFMNLRIQISSKGDLLIGKNDGFWLLGNARSYKKGSVYCMTWNGSSMEEKWHTRETQNYMPAYLFDEPRNELLILQTVQRPGMTGRGASSLAVKKVE